MANNSTLFLSVSQANAESFKSSTRSELGFVSGSDSEGFGYIIAKGGQFGASYNQVSSIANNAADTAYANALSYVADNYMKKGDAANVSVSATKNNVVTNDGTKYTLSISDGVLSLSKYVAVSISASNQNFSSLTSVSGNGDVLLGSAYSLSASIHTENANSSFKYTVNNPTQNEIAIVGESFTNNSGNTSYISGGITTISNGVATSTSAIEYSSSAYNSIRSISVPFSTTPVNASNNGTITWSAAVSCTATNTAGGTVTVYIHEKGASSLTSYSFNVSSNPSSVTASATAYAYFYQYTQAITSTNHGDGITVKYGESLSSKIPSVTFAANSTPSVAYPTVWGTLTLKQMGLGDTSFKSSSITINDIPYTVLTKSESISSEQTWTCSWS